MTPRTAHAHDIVVAELAEREDWAKHGWKIDGWEKQFGIEYWTALQSIINASPNDWSECDDVVKAAAVAAVADGNLDGSDNVRGEE